MRSKHTPPGKSIPAIPTTYASVRFRSRLEARWAAFFDLLGWRWVYEPFDLKGYIPDFVIRFEKRPLLIEVKPALTMEETEFVDSFSKIVDSGWESEALCVGADLDIGDPNMYPVMGWMLVRDEFVSDDWREATLCRCHDCQGLFPCSDDGSFNCRHCGEPEENGLVSSFSDIASLWAIAGNRVQWRGR